MIPRPLTPLASGIRWRDTMSLPAYQILLLPMVSAEDEFTLEVDNADVHGGFRALFSHNGRISYSTIYDDSSNSLSWIARAGNGIMLKRSAQSSGKLTYSCLYNTLIAQSNLYCDVETTGSMSTPIGIHTSTGRDLSCLVIGTCFEPDYSGYRYVDAVIEFTSLSIQANGRSIILGQDTQGRFYDRKHCVRITALDTRTCGLVYNA